MFWLFQMNCHFIFDVLAALREMVFKGFEKNLGYWTTDVFPLLSPSHAGCDSFGDKMLWKFPRCVGIPSSGESRGLPSLLTYLSWVLLGLVLSLRPISHWLDSQSYNFISGQFHLNWEVGKEAGRYQQRLKSLSWEGNRPIRGERMRKCKVTGNSDLRSYANA